MDINFGLKPAVTADPAQVEYGPDIMRRMMEAATAYKGKASPANQPFVIDKLKGAGFTMGQITDWLPHLMYHLGAPEVDL